MKMKFLKSIIAPFQAVLMNKKLCPACTMPLDKAPKRDNYRNGLEMVTCRCGRMFIFDPETDTYRRALVSEAQDYDKLSLKRKKEVSGGHRVESDSRGQDKK